MKRTGVFKALKGLAFFALFCVLFFAVSGILVNPEINEGHRQYQWIRGYYDEPEDSLDAIIVGSSSVYTLWQAPVAYEKYGIKIYPFSFSSQPLTEAEAIISNIRDRQSDALFIISTNTIYGYDRLHCGVDYIPARYRFQFVRDMTESEQMPFFESLEYFFPLIRFHDRWSQLLYEDFHYELDRMKGGSHFYGFLNGVTDVSEEDETPFDPVSLNPTVEARILDLLDYCDRTDADVLFMSSPWVGTRREIEQIKIVNRLIESKGFPVLDLMEHMDELGLDMKVDYQDIRHTNVHGSLKTTDYLARYLLDHYDFPDKPGGYYDSSWNEAYVKYKDIITPYLTEEELKQLP